MMKKSELRFETGVEELIYQTKRKERKRRLERKRKERETHKRSQLKRDTSGVFTNSRNSLFRIGYYHSFCFRFIFWDIFFKNTFLATSSGGALIPHTATFVLVESGHTHDLYSFNYSTGPPRVWYSFKLSKADLRQLSDFIL